MGLGGYPAIGLAKARELAGEYRSVLADGLDPIAARNEKRAAAAVAAAKAMTFAEFVAIVDASTKGRGGFSAGFSAGFQRYDWPVILLQTAAAIYLMIRGFDNLDQWWSDKRSERRVRHMAFVRSIFDEIDANLRSLDIDEIKKKLEPLKIGYSIQSPIFEPGAFLYRARLIAPTFNKTDGIMRKDLIYPPANVAPLGRLNRAGQPAFYCSMHKESVFFELPDLKAGDELILTFWDQRKDVRKQHWLHRVCFSTVRCQTVGPSMESAIGQTKKRQGNDCPCGASAGGGPDTAI